MTRETEFLKRLFITNRRNSSGKVSTIEAPEVSLFEIELYDNTGKLRKLSEVAADNKVVLLSLLFMELNPRRLTMLSLIRCMTAIRKTDWKYIRWA